MNKIKLILLFVFILSCEDVKNSFSFPFTITTDYYEVTTDGIPVAYGLLCIADLIDLDGSYKNVQVHGQILKYHTGGRTVVAEDSSSFYSDGYMTDEIEVFDKENSVGYADWRVYFDYDTLYTYKYSIYLTWD